MALTLTAMRGYPGSGKSTKAREIADATGAVVVCRDDLRKMLHGVYFNTGDNHPKTPKEFEDQVTIAERAAVQAYLKEGVSVVVDATHLEPSYLRKWAKMSAQYGAEFVRVDVPTPAWECIRRDAEYRSGTPKYVGPEVITRMAKRHPIKNWPNIQAPPTFNPEPVEWQMGLPAAIIVDIDGTLAHMAGRSPYDYTQVHTDTVDEQVRWLVNTIHQQSSFFNEPSPKVLIVSGRDDTCREATEKWLAEHGIRYDALHMRPTGSVDNHGNKLPDYMVKSALFDKHIRGKYNVRFVLDDRNQVVDLWRSLGLKCLQVQPGDF
ncbi:polynucleotide kinase [Mycobacterium phage Krypton555]|uniref:Polynucleotide kinase n=1 Tax=Mycobacterium phage Krypton555 TaxID=2015885 RepID=A0A222ZQV1_9CAUD|nr:polynucleotide kinase [Mycobacterium phage Krypton555]ASR87113.1 polynucleotide kinase [Mycobacterium phage Krypton555]